MFNFNLIEAIVSNHGPILAVKGNMFVTIDANDQTQFLVWDFNDGTIIGALPSDRRHRFNADISCFAGRAQHALSVFTNTKCRHCNNIESC